MKTIAELIKRRITPEPRERNTPIWKIYQRQSDAKSKKPHALYEAEVFNYLLDKKDDLGIKSVWKFTALVVDGAVELVDGTHLTVEIKFRMNWAKACQAEWQFRTFFEEN